MVSQRWQPAQDANSLALEEEGEGIFWERGQGRATKKVLEAKGVTYAVGLQENREGSGEGGRGGEAGRVGRKDSSLWWSGWGWGCYHPTGSKVPPSNSKLFCTSAACTSPPHPAPHLDQKYIIPENQWFWVACLEQTHPARTQASSPKAKPPL